MNDPAPADSAERKPSTGPIVRLRRIIGQIGRTRLLLAILQFVVLVFIARSSWHIPLLIDAEHALFDARMIVTAPKVRQDDRIVIVPYTDQTLINTGKRSPLDRTTLAKALKRIDTMGARAIGVDILIDQPQGDDAVLIDAFRSMKTPTYLAHASTESAGDKIIYEQQQFLEQFQRQIAQGGNVHPTSIVIQTDSDNVLRRWADIMPGAPPRMPNALAPQAAAFTRFTGSVAYRRPALIDEPIFAAIPIDTFAEDALFTEPAAAAVFSQQIKGKYVLIGGNIEDTDIFQTPLTRSAGKNETKQAWGIELFAHMLAQALDGRLPRPIPNALLWLATVLVAAGGIATAAVSRRPILSIGMVTAQLGAVAGLPFYLAWVGFETYALPAAGWLVEWFGALIIAEAAARALGAEQRRFAQSALGKYLPANIASEILRDPEALELGGQKREIFVMFSDLEGFTKLSHAIAPELVARLLNRYLEDLSAVVLEHGGTIDKFVGDAVVAFWGAPISRPDDGERAMRAALAIHAAGEGFRNSTPQGVPPIGMTRVGLHFGEAIVGNFGGKGRIQYTALGDSMNTAARLESANKQTGTTVLVSEEAAMRSGLDIFRPLGQVVLRGRASAIGICQPVPEMAPQDRRAFTELANAAIAGEAAAVRKLTERAEADPQDKALAKLVYRLEHQEAGGYFVLD